MWLQVFKIEVQRLVVLNEAAETRLSTQAQSIAEVLYGRRATIQRYVCFPQDPFGFLALTPRLTSGEFITMIMFTLSRITSVAVLSIASYGIYFTCVFHAAPC